MKKNEYQYKGHRYDVIQREEKSNEVTVQLAHDSYEEELISFLNAFFKHTRSPQQSRGASNFKKGMIKRFFAMQYRVFQYSFSISYRLRPEDIKLPSAPHFDVAKPPPRQA